MRGQVLVLAKAPVPGLVKTRLCPPCTPEQAARIASAALADTVDAATRTTRLTIATTGPLAAAGPIAPYGVSVVPQRGDGLAARIAAAFADAGPGPTLQIGMDTPQAGPALLTAGLARLDQAVDAVLGLAEDGGWWALGLHDPAHARLLAGVPMSTPDTGRLTLAALHGAGLRIGLLPVLRDVDTWADAVAVAALVPGSRFAAAVAAVAVRPAGVRA